MRRSVLNGVVRMVALVLLGGCASKAPPPPLALPIWTPHGANFASAPGVPVFGRMAMPQSFTLTQPWPALWLLRGTEVAVVGKQGDRTMVIGLSGAHFDTSRLIAADYGPLAEHGIILDLAVSPDGSVLAAAVFDREENRLELVARSLLGEGDPGILAAYDGRIEVASLSWLDANTLALALKRAAESAREAPGKRTEIHIVDTRGRELSRRTRLGCDFLRLHWSADGRFAFVEGSSGPAALTFARERQGCEILQAPANIRFIGWAPGANRFLYFGALAGATSAGGYAVFEYDLDSDSSRLIALASAAATYTKTGEIAVLGNRNLTWRLLATRPEAPIIAEVALVNTQTSETRINTLGVKTAAGMLAESAASYSPAADTIAMEMPVPGSPANSLLLLYFTISTGSGGVLANGTAGGLARLSWAPEGNLLAVLDAESYPPTLTILAPPG